MVKSLNDLLYNWLVGDSTNERQQPLIPQDDTESGWKCCEKMSDIGRVCCLAVYWKLSEIGRVCCLAVYWAFSQYKMKNEGADVEEGGEREGRDGRSDAVAMRLETVILLSPLTILSIAIMAYFIVYLRVLCDDENETVKFFIAWYFNTHLIGVALFFIFVVHLIFQTKEYAYQQLSECRYLQYGMFVLLMFSFLFVWGSIIVKGPTVALVGLAVCLIAELFSLVWVCTCITLFTKLLPSVRVFVELGINVFKCAAYISIAENVWNTGNDHSLFPGMCALAATVSSIAQFISAYFSVGSKCNLLIAFNAFVAAAVFAAFLFTMVLCAVPKVEPCTTSIYSPQVNCTFSSSSTNKV